jgi:hypothetical protein
MGKVVVYPLVQHHIPPGNQSFVRVPDYAEGEIVPVNLHINDIDHRMWVGDSLTSFYLMQGLRDGRAGRLLDVDEYEFSLMVDDHIC